MPVYEYECRACGKRHEATQGMSEPPLTTCPSCKGEIYRIISAPGLSFKGQGWYITDYARKEKETDGRKSVSEKKEVPSPAPTSTTDKKETATPPPSATPEKKGPSQPETK